MQDFVEYVPGSFSSFNNIEIAYSNFTPSFFEFSWKLSQIQENEHTPGVFHLLEQQSRLWGMICPETENLCFKQWYFDY